jgi:hypothetical protein
MRRNVLIGTGAAVVVTVVAAGLAFHLGRRSSTPHGEAARATTAPSAVTQLPGSTSLGPRAVVDGVPVGWRHDAAGARAAAVAAVGLTPTLARAGFVTLRDMVATLATAAYGSALAAATTAQVDEMTFTLGAHDASPADLLLLEQPVTAQVQAFTPEVATVAVWSVVVVGAPGSVPPRQVWRTVTVRLRWERDDWRVDDWTVAAGPNPATSPELAPADYDAVAMVAGWPVATSAGQP